MTEGLKKLVFIFFAFLLVTAGDVYGQVPVKRSENKVIIEGKIYYIHIVKPGQTLYSIARAYEVSEKDIALENPGVYSGLQVGHPLKIPADVPKVSPDLQEEIDTSKFIIHRIKAGETLYSLSGRYNVTVAQIKDVNPDINLRDLDIGQRILIPKMKTVWSEDDFFLHKVRRKETIYSLSKRYGITGEDIIKYNPELKWGDLKAGKVIRIPKEDFLARQEVEEVSDFERMDTLFVEDEPEEEIDELSIADSLGLDRMTIRDYYSELKEFNTRRLKVAFLIPFNYREIVEEPEEESENNEENEEEEEEPAENLPRSINFLEFFEGSLLALDSLRKEGIDAEVRYFDTYRSPTKVREILSSPYFRDVDLIIGPFFAYNVEIVSEFSRQNRIPLISPFYDGYDLTLANPYLFQISPSYKTEFSRAAEILSKEYDKNFIFIYKENNRNYHEIEFFKSSLLQKLGRFIHTENVILKEISYLNPAKENLSKDFSHALSKDKQNIVIIPEKDEAFVSSIIHQLYFQLRDFEIEVFGMPHFSEFPNANYKYYHELNLSYLSAFYYDYQDEQVNYFLEHFVQNFKTEPRLSTRKGAPYAFIGYDLSYFFIKKIAEWDRRFVSRLNSDQIDNLLPSYHFTRQSSYGGFENQTLRKVTFTEDYEIHSRETNIELEPEIPERMRRYWYDNNED